MHGKHEMVILTLLWLSQFHSNDTHIEFICHILLRLNACVQYVGCLQGNMCLRQELGVNSPLLVVSAMSCLMDYKTLIYLKKTDSQWVSCFSHRPTDCAQCQKSPIGFFLNYILLVPLLWDSGQFLFYDPLLVFFQTSSFVGDWYRIYMFPQDLLN